MPTARGWGLLIATLASYVASWWLGFPELSTVGTAGLLALVAARGVLRASTLEVEREVAPVRVVRGDPAVAVLTARNRGRFRSRSVVAADRVGAESTIVELPSLGRGRSHTAGYLLPTRRRGEIPVGPLRITATDPFGLFRITRSYGTPVILLVHPRTVELDQVPSGRAASVEGPTSRNASAGTVTFQGLREYVFGDDLRHVHWRTTARTNTLMVRELLDASLPRTTVLLDTRLAAYPGDDEFEIAIDVAASVASAAARSGFPTTVLDPLGQIHAADGGREGVAGLLQRLALVVPVEQRRPASRAAGRAEPTLADAIAAARPGPSGGSLVVVTGGAVTAELGQLGAARHRFDTAILIRVGSGLPALPASLPVRVIDADDLATLASAWRDRGRGR
jgi:uncharacterized protein (DUF58 family)